MEQLPFGQLGGLFKVKDYGGTGKRYRYRCGFLWQKENLRSKRFNIKDLKEAIGRNEPTGVKLVEPRITIGCVAANYDYGVTSGSERSDYGDDAVQIVGVERHCGAVHIGTQKEDLTDCRRSAEEGEVTSSRNEACAECGRAFMEPPRSDDYGIAARQALLMPAKVIEEDLSERTAGVVDVCANPSAAFTLQLKALYADTLGSGERTADEASEVGGEVGERVHAAKLRRDLPMKA